MAMVCDDHLLDPPILFFLHTQTHTRLTDDAFNNEKTGEISAAELGDVMRSLGLKPTDGELQDMLHEVDSDNSGTIDINGMFFLLPLICDCLTGSILVTNSRNLYLHSLKKMLSSRRIPGSHVSCGLCARHGR